MTGREGRERDAHAPLEPPQVRESCVRVQCVCVRLAHFSLCEDVYLCRDENEREGEDELVLRMDATHPRACAQLLDRGVDCGLVYTFTSERLEDLTFPEERGKHAAGSAEYV